MVFDEINDPEPHETGGVEAASDEVARLASSTFGHGFAGVSTMHGLKLHLKRPSSDGPAASAALWDELVLSFRGRFPELIIEQNATYSLQELEQAFEELQSRWPEGEREGGLPIAMSWIAPEKNSIVVIIDPDQGVDLKAIQRKLGPIFSISDKLELPE